MATKQKSSTTENKTAQVLLRNLDSGQSQPFAPDHAERLLAYPGTRFARLDEGNADAAAAKTAPAAPFKADETGHPHAV